MRTLAITAGLLVLQSGSKAQNLVPNGSFEEYTECPTSEAQIDRATGWSYFSGTPDYFHACNSNDSMDVPLNLIGYQAAFDGEGYAGLATFLEGTPTFRECVQRELSEPLVPGVTYHLSMVASPGGFGNDPGNNSTRFAASGVGLKFAMEERSSPYIWPGNVAMSMMEILDDTSTWVALNGEYTPDSAYSWVVVGGFLPDEELDTATLDPNGIAHFAYAFVDRVCVSQSESDCFVSIGIREHTQVVRWLGPNVVTDELSFELGPDDIGVVRVSIVDALGRVWSSRFVSPRAPAVNWPISTLMAGSYLLVSDSRRFLPQRFLVFRP